MEFEKVSLPEPESPDTPILNGLLLNLKKSFWYIPSLKILTVSIIPIANIIVLNNEFGIVIRLLSFINVEKIKYSLPEAKFTGLTISVLIKYNIEKNVTNIKDILSLFAWYNTKKGIVHINHPGDAGVNKISNRKLKHVIL